MSSDYDSNPTRNGGSIAPFLLGLATGSIAALLLAPMSGVEMRRRIADNAQRARDEANTLAGAASEKAAAKYEEASDQARELVETTKEAARTQSRAVKKAVAEGREAYERELAKTT